MDLGDCYRLLGLRSGASFADIKASYRRLAQQYHPDINPDDNKAKDKFIALTEAYRLLLQVVDPQEIAPQPTQTVTVTRPEPTVTEKPKTTPKTKPTPQPPQVSEKEQQLKWQTYEQLQIFLKQRRFPQAIALAEALAARLPEDAEVRQWQAIAYQIWGRVLIKENQPLKAKIYLKKALKTDPHNKALWNEVQRDFQKLE
ncbi:molecular chaperone DnaJ [Fischerella thermalis CCMEE 5268]|uniref:Molecular chaperone DnaJ n=2 Tax=Fischerella thermalis TaxID=372787 RepID=A0A2N6LA41_9CYAN|nr:J domain-containing protein [Fischerella thermalis]PLZ98046.1 molecular chaperone DnaJ [Fischerella thermalis CCMEE 5268]PMB19254.1 molecular chaperone DnaJ [Fischerella thermalis CCMEE 5318]PMB46094.1 molecular chaperone DnaJ [Fischerella thermalis CCMEE 5205]